MEAIISEIQIYEERQPSGQWLKSMKFKIPIIEEDMEIGLDNDKRVETVCPLSNRKCAGNEPKLEHAPDSGECRDTAESRIVKDYF